MLGASITVLTLLMPRLAAAQGAVTSVTFSPPSPVTPGTTVTVTVNGTSPCGGIEINFGDGTDVVFPISQPPLVQTHQYNTAGTFTVTAKGQGNCSGQVSATLVVQTRPADLTIRLAQNTPSPVVSLTPVEYEIRVGNSGGSRANNVSVRVTFPGTGWRAESGFGPECGFSDGLRGSTESTAICSTPFVQPGDTKSFRFKLRARTFGTPSDTTTFTITATVDPSNTVQESNEGNNTDRVATTIVRQAELEPDVTGLPLTATGGQQLTYVIKIKNSGDAGARNAVTHISLPHEVDFVSADASELGPCTPTIITGRNASQSVSCTAPLIAPGTTASVRIVTRVITGLADGFQMVLGFTADFTKVVVERDERNNTAGVATRISSPTDLAITAVTVDRGPLPPTSRPGDVPLSCDPDGAPGSGNGNTTVHVTVTNLGPGAVAQTTLRAQWKSGVFEAVNSDCAGGDHCVERLCKPIPRTPTLIQSQSVPILGAGESKVFVFKALRVIDDTSLGTFTVDNLTLNDPDRSNNTRTIK